MATPAPKDARHDLAGASTLGNLFPIHVLIATYDRDTLLERTLRTLAAAERPDGFESIYVVENGPPGGAEGICRRMAAELPIRFHHIEQSGKSRANQWAIEQIRTGFVIFFDDDVRVDPRTLVAYAAAASEGARLTVFLASSCALVLCSAVAVGAAAWLGRAVPVVWLERGGALLFIVLGCWFMWRSFQAAPVA